jgi:hypothetical protein
MSRRVNRKAVRSRIADDGFYVCLQECLEHPPARHDSMHVFCVFRGTEFAHFTWAKCPQEALARHSRLRRGVRVKKCDLCESSKRPLNACEDAHHDVMSNK